MWEAAQADPVDELAELVRWTGPGIADFAWGSAEQELGTALPASYKEYVSRFPAGEFQTYLVVGHLQDQADVADFVENVRDELLGLQIVTQNVAEFTYGIYPQIPGLLPWGRVGDSEILCWHLTGVSEHSPEIVSVSTFNAETDTFQGSIAEYIIAMLRGHISQFRWFAEVCIPPSFDPLWFGNPPMPRPSDEYLNADPGRSMAVAAGDADAVDDLVDLVGTVPLPEPTDWSVRERRLRHPLPPDYKRFIDTIGPGRYGDIFVASPSGYIWEYPGVRAAEAESNLQRGGMAELTYRADTELQSGTSDRTSWPIVWGEARGWFCGWMPGNYPRNLRPVLVFRPGHRGQVYRHSMTSYLASHLRDPIAWEASLWRIGESE